MRSSEDVHKRLFEGKIGLFLAKQFRALVPGLLLYLAPVAALSAGDKKEFSDYAGSESCKECHAKEYELWAKSHHALAERPVRPELENSAFSPVHSVKHASQTSEVSVRDGMFQIKTLGFQTNVQPYRVERVIGVDPVRQFLTAAPGGRWQVQEFSYDTRRNEWFDVYGDEDRKPDEWGHWTGRGMNWNSRCADCHNTAVRKNYDEATDGYHTTTVEMGVGCEACHGPLKQHVEWENVHPNAKSKDPTVRRLSSAQMLDTCGSCHARADSLTGEFKPGDPFFDHYSLQILDDAERWYPDGQVKDEDYEFTSFLSSKMHASGVTCQDCHDPHSAKTRLTGNDLCMRCHNGSFPKAPKMDIAAHTHHQTMGKGNECIGCHMPITTYMQRHPRHDHGFTIPDPILTKELGIPNACNRCHENRTADWSAGYVEQWYGTNMMRHTRERARWIASAQKGEDNGKLRMASMLTVETEGPYWRATAASMLWRWVNEPKVQGPLIAGLQNKDALVREKAARSLGDLEHPENIAELKAALVDSDRNVRVAAAWALKATVSKESRACKELQASMDFDSDQPTGQFHQALFVIARREPQAAPIHLRTAITQDGFSPPLRYELAEVLNQLGRHDEALASLEEAEKLIPSDPQLPYERAKMLLQLHRYTEANAAANRSLKLQPDFRPALNLIKVLQALGEQAQP